MAAATHDCPMAVVETRFGNQNLVLSGREAWSEPEALHDYAQNVSRIAQEHLTTTMSSYSHSQLSSYAVVRPSGEMDVTCIARRCTQVIIIIILINLIILNIIIIIMYIL